jgi:hypothetical protein
MERVCYLLPKFVIVVEVPEDHLDVCSSTQWCQLEGNDNRMEVLKLAMQLKYVVRHRGATIG